MAVEISDLVVGGQYVLRHNRFGTATVRVMSVGAEWVEVEIEGGTLRGKSDQWGPGETKSVRASQCVFSVTG